MKNGDTRRRKKHPVPWKEFERLMKAISEQTRDYPQEALEEIVLHLDMIEKRYGIAQEVGEEDVIV
jgi:hypothetical protein